MRPLKAYILLTVLCSALYGADSGLTSDDVQKIKQLHEKYRQTWLAGDAEGVRSVFVDEPVLLPDHGATPRVGHDQLNAFWFPPGAPPTKVLKLNLTYEEIGGAGSTAYVWGTYDLSWTAVQPGKRTIVSSKGTYLNVLRKLDNGEWRISHHMWDDPLPTQ